MNEFYKEILVKKETTSADVIKKYGLLFLTVAAFVAFILVHPLFIIAAVGLGVACYFLLPTFDLEYEYLYVNGDIDVDRIMGKQKRKRAGSYNLEEMEIIAPAGSHELDSYRARGGKVIDYTSGRSDAKCYTAVYMKDGQQQMVSFEFDQEVLKDLRRLAPRKVSRECL